MLSKFKKRKFRLKNSERSMENHWSFSHDFVSNSNVEFCSSEMCVFKYYN